MTWYSIIHGPEAWLAVAIWGVGAMFGIAASWIAIEINDRRERHEPNSLDMDSSDSGGGGSAPRRDTDSGGRR